MNNFISKCLETHPSRLIIITLYLFFSWSSYAQYDEASQIRNVHYLWRMCNSLSLIYASGLTAHNRCSPFLVVSLSYFLWVFQLNKTMGSLIIISRSPKLRVWAWKRWMKSLVILHVSRKQILSVSMRSSVALVWQRRGNVPVGLSVQRLKNKINQVNHIHPLHIWFCLYDIVWRPWKKTNIGISWFGIQRKRHCVTPVFCGDILHKILPCSKLPYV